MTKFKLLSASFVAAAMLAAPAMASENHMTSRHLERAAVSVPASARYVDGQVCIPAPRVGAFATQPWDNGPPCEPVQGGY
jgi:hypothetical protein